MKGYIILILVIALVIGCNTSVKNEKLKNSKNSDEKSTVQPILNSSIQDTIKTFLEYINFMAIVQLPLKITCNNPYFPTYEIYRNNEYGVNFKPDGATIIGKLRSNDKFAAVIYSYPADISLPVLETYNLSGAKIDELQLLNYPRCTNDVDSIETNSSLIINEDFTIQIIDSIFEVNKKKNDQFLRSLQKTEIKKYRINESGSIIK